MYIPASFAETRPQVLREIIRTYPFATLISTAPDGQPSVSHLPLLLDMSRGSSGLLIGHLARANPHATELATVGPLVLAIFHGPHAYVSPTWYETKPAVPTWNYAVVHVRGRVNVFRESGRVREILDVTVRAFELDDSPWQMSDLPAAYLQSMSAGVVAFEIEIGSVEGKFKLSQNRSAIDQAGVVEALSHGDAEAVATARLMQRRSEQ